MGRRGGEKEEARELGREPGKPGQPSPTALVSLFANHSLARHLACYPGEHPGLVIARGELGSGMGEGAQPVVTSLG